MIKIVIEGHQRRKTMYQKSSSELPLGFSMALAHNVKSFNAFLALDDKKQDEIIEKARNAQTKREMQQLVDNISLQ